VDEFPLDQALDRLDKTLAKLGYPLQGDVEWQDERDGEVEEFCCRVYGAKDAVTVLIVAQAGVFDVLFVSELAPGRWLVTGLADDFERLVLQARTHGAANMNMTVHCLDDTPRAIE